MRHTVFVLQNTLHPQDRRDLPMLDADLLADQVFGFLDTRIGIDEHEAVAEPTMQEDRNGIERFVLILGDEIGRAGGLSHIKVLIVIEPPNAASWNPYPSEQSGQYRRV